MTVIGRTKLMILVTFDAQLRNFSKPRVCENVPQGNTLEFLNILKFP